MNWFYFIPVISFGILFFMAAKKTRIVLYSEGKVEIVKNYLPLLSIGLYLLSALLIFFVDPELWYPEFSTASYTATNFFIYSVILFLYLLPTLYFKPIVKKTALLKTKTLTLLMFFISLMGWYSFIYLIPFAARGMMMNPEDLRSLMNTENYFILPQGLQTTLAIGTSYFYLFYIAFFFISIIQKQHFFIRLSLFVGSISYIVAGLSFATRDVFVFYMLGFLFIYYFFKPLLSNSIEHFIKKCLILFGSLVISAIIFYSYHRFENSDRSALAYGTIGYLAQQPFVFSETIEKQTYFSYGDTYFPIIKGIFTEAVEPEKKTEAYLWSFGTFIANFYSEGGWLFLIIITLVFVPFFYFKLRFTKKINFYQNMIVVLFYYQFISQGVFYFKMGSRAGNIYIIILSFIYFSLFFKLKERRMLSK